MASSRTPRTARAKARQPWNPLRLLVVIPAALASLIVPFVALVYIARNAFNLLSPEGTLFCTPTRLSMIILFFVLLFLAGSLGGMFATLLWSPRRQRRSDLKFLLKIGAIPFPIYLLALGSMVCVSETEIQYRSQLLAGWQRYHMSQIVSVRPDCSRGSRGGWDVRLYLTMDDGRSFDLAALHPWLPSSWQRVVGELSSRPWDNSNIDRDCPNSRRRLISPPA
jgi:hypothetical protein